MGKKGYSVGYLTDHYLVDKHTGEVKNVRLITLEPKRDKAFFKVFNAFAEDVLQDKELAGKPIRLLFYILNRLDLNEIVVVLDAKKVADELGIGERTLFRWLRILIKKEILIKTKKRGVYLLNPAKVIVGKLETIKPKLPYYAEILGIDDEVIAKISSDIALNDAKKG